MPFLSSSPGPVLPGPVLPGPVPAGPVLPGPNPQGPVRVVTRPPSAAVEFLAVLERLGASRAAPAAIPQAVTAPTGQATARPVGAVTDDDPAVAGVVPEVEIEIEAGVTPVQDDEALFDDAASQADIGLVPADVSGDSEDGGAIWTPVHGEIDAAWQGESGVSLRDADLNDSGRSGLPGGLGQKDPSGGGSQPWIPTSVGGGASPNPARAEVPGVRLHRFPSGQAGFGDLTLARRPPAPESAVAVWRGDVPSTSERTILPGSVPGSVPGSGSVSGPSTRPSIDLDPGSRRFAVAASIPDQTGRPAVSGPEVRTGNQPASAETRMANLVAGKSLGLEESTRERLPAARFPEPRLSMAGQAPQGRAVMSGPAATVSEGAAMVPPRGPAGDATPAPTLPTVQAPSVPVTPVGLHPVFRPESQSLPQLAVPSDPAAAMPDPAGSAVVDDRGRAPFAAPVTAPVAATVGRTPPAEGATRIGSVSEAMAAPAAASVAAPGSPDRQSAEMSALAGLQELDLNPLSAFAGGRDLLVPRGGDPGLQAAQSAAPPPAPAPGPAPHLAPADPVARQLHMAITTLDQGGTEIRLDPQELGHVRLSLHSTDSTVTMSIHVERPDTLDMVRRSIDGLAAELRALGYGAVDISLTGGGTQPGGRGPDGPPQAGAEDAATAPPAPPAITRSPLTPAASPDGGLDLRL